MSKKTANAIHKMSDNEIRTSLIWDFAYEEMREELGKMNREQLIALYIHNVCHNK